MNRRAFLTLSAVLGAWAALGPLGVWRPRTVPAMEEERCTYPGRDFVMRGLAGALIIYCEGRTLVLGPGCSGTFVRRGVVLSVTNKVDVPVERYCLPGMPAWLPPPGSRLVGGEKPA